MPNLSVFRSSFIVFVFVYLSCVLFNHRCCVFPNKTVISYYYDYSRPIQRGHEVPCLAPRTHQLYTKKFEFLIWSRLLPSGHKSCAVVFSCCYGNWSNAQRPEMDSADLKLSKETWLVNVRCSVLELQFFSCCCFFSSFFFSREEALEENSSGWLCRVFWLFLRCISGSFRHYGSYKPPGSFAAIFLLGWWLSLFLVLKVR